MSKNDRLKRRFSMYFISALAKLRECTEEKQFSDRVQTFLLRNGSIF